MCGICGVIEKHGVQAKLAGLNAMCASLAHRGPDDEGVKRLGRTGLGQRRLSIIDLAGGHQPLCNESGDVWATFNGEIYNFRELRAQLLRAGHHFESDTDSEVLVHGYEQWGDELVTRLRGMFAFAIWDERNQRLLLARDRFGIKPLFYSFIDGRLLFGSEIKALIAYAPALADELDTHSLNLAFSLPYIPAPRTAYTHIRKLLPAHTLVWKNEALAIARYWNVADIAEKDYGEAAAMERLEARLESAVKSHLVSDVPLGAFLSGGVDSSVVVAMMARSATTRVKTFSISFGENRFNEAPYARAVAEHLGTEHVELTVTPDSAGLVDTIVRHFDEPFFDSSAIPTYYVSRLAREHVTVILTGDGGDEMFGGYQHYQKYRVVQMLRHMPQSARKRLLALTQGAKPASKRASLRRLLSRSLQPFPERYRRAFGWSTTVRELLLSPELQAAGSLDSEFGFDFSTQGDVRDAMLFDALSLMPDDFLCKVDRMSMAHALETRVPLLDHELAEFARSLPLNLKLRGRTTKYLLKKLTAKLVPPQAVYRPKMGFALPLPQWFRHDWRDMTRDLLLGPNALCRDYLNQAGIAKVIDMHQSGQANWHEVLWALIFFETWLTQRKEARHR